MRNHSDKPRKMVSKGWDKGRRGQSQGMKDKRRARYEDNEPMEYGGLAGDPDWKDSDAHAEAVWHVRYDGE